MRCYGATILVEFHEIAFVTALRKVFGVMVDVISTAFFAISCAQLSSNSGSADFLET